MRRKGSRHNWRVDSVDHSVSLNFPTESSLSLACLEISHAFYTLTKPGLMKELETYSSKV